MSVVTKPLVRMQKGERQLPHGLRQVLAKDVINKFIEKIAPKSDRGRLARKTKETLYYLLNGKKNVTKVVFA